MLQQSHEIMKKSKKTHKEYQKFIDKYSREGINYEWRKVDWKNFEKNNFKISLNVFKKCHLKNGIKKFPDSNPEKLVIILIIPNGEGWDHLAVKKLSVLSAGITSKHHGDFVVAFISSQQQQN